MTRRIALLGNPNVGKSTVFNALTGMHQKTANWAGVTVSCTTGYFSVEGRSFSVIDLPGIYSFDIRSAEEAVTRDFVQSGEYEYLLLICDATCLERGLHLLRQAAGLLRERQAGTRQPGPDAPACGSGTFPGGSGTSPGNSGAGPMQPPQLILCVNLCDEAEKKGIQIDFQMLEQVLGIPVAGCKAREKDGLRELMEILARPSKPDTCACSLSPDSLTFIHKLPSDFSPADLAAQAAVYTKKDYREREERLDRFLTGPFTGGLTMCILLFGVFWLTITGANYPSAVLWDLLFRLEAVLVRTARAAGAPQWFVGAFIYGLYRVAAWIISVMLPPMAIFFPLFTLLEDFGYLPRAAFNLDGAFCKCRACGKQCLTMAMGLGCNAAGVTGCRIIDSPRERLIAILTNSLMPCNGRFPLLLTMISLFAAGIGGVESIDAESVGIAAEGIGAGTARRITAAASLSAFLLTLFILAGVAATLISSWLLSRTLLKGVPSSFTLELPPYRRPQFGKVLIRSVFDRTLFVLGRAVAVAAPAGLIIWVFANVRLGDSTLLALFSGFLDPPGRLLGLDGIILMAFILGFPANEIVLPIILMAYLQTGILVPMDDKSALFSLLAAHGWTLKTIVCMAAFSLFHWPCSTTCLTIKKETGSLKWAAVSFLIPTVIGAGLCILISALWNIAGL